MSRGLTKTSTKTRIRHASLFVDSGVLLAAAIPSDAYHERAVDVLERVTAGGFRSAHTTDYVVAECLNFIQSKRGRVESAHAVHEMVFGSQDRPPVIRHLHKVHGARFAAALDNYISSFPRGLSLTDWTSVIVMEEHGIDAVATFDRGFAAFATIVDT